MKLNVFKIQQDRVQDLKTNLKRKGYIEESSGNDLFFKRCFSIKEDLEIPIWWTKDLGIYLNDSREKLTNKVYSSVLVYESIFNSYAITFGKSHFYVRDFCDSDFGTRIAKKIADKNEVKTIAIKKFNEKKKKEIRSYVDKNKIDIDGGESADYMQASIIDRYKDDFGNKAKFGESVIFTTHKSFVANNISNLLEKLIEVEKLEDSFKLPKAIECVNQIKIEELDKELLDTIYDNSSEYDFSLNSYNLVGADFIFSGNERYELSFKEVAKEELTELSSESLISFINKNSIHRDNFFLIKLKIIREETGLSGHTESIKKCLDFTSSKYNIILDHGKWRELNDDYIYSLNESVDDIEKNNNSDYEEITLSKISKNGEQNKWEGEDEFNKSLENNGYINTDKNFSILELTGYKIEAWDLQKDDVVYAVKFGTAKGLSYVCDQAIATLEIIKSVEKYKTKLKDIKVKKFCLWLGFSNVNKINNISDVDSLILKQKIQAWKKTCEKIGVTPVIKISKVIKQ